MFTKEEENKIGLIMTMSKENNALRKNLEDKYDNNPSLLNPYEIYVLEVVFEYGYKGYFDELSSCFQTENTCTYSRVMPLHIH